MPPRRQTVTRTEVDRIVAQVSAPSLSSDTNSWKHRMAPMPAHTYVGDLVSRV